jgi:transcriptional regulator with XRE-family HTH domain
MERTQAFLDANGITQTELGEALGVGGAAVSRKLSGSRNWKLVEVQTALAWLSARLTRPVTYEEVFGSTDAPEPEPMVAPVSDDPAA